MARAIGGMRRMESLAKGLKGCAGFDLPGVWDTDIEGAAAELAYCKFRGQYWGGTVNTFKAADVGVAVQIRSTPRPNGSLILRPGDDDSHYYVLVTGMIPKFRIVGWLRGREGKRDEFKQNPNNRPPAFFVPQSVLKLF